MPSIAVYKVKKKEKEKKQSLGNTKIWEHTESFARKKESEELEGKSLSEKNKSKILKTEKSLCDLHFSLSKKSVFLFAKIFWLTFISRDL